MNNSPKSSKSPKIGLNDAYSVQTPDDNKTLYKNWASSYDQTFAEQRGYHYPQHIAQIYHRFAERQHSPVLDVGAGTGLVAEQLRLIQGGRDLVIDGIDISPEMLRESGLKGCYRNLLEADLCKTLPLDDHRYGAIVSAGTFTHGHVGPSAFKELIRVAKVGALFCIGINAQAFDRYGFGSAFAALQADDLIGPLEFVKANYYHAADDQNADDIGYTAVFRKS